MIADSEIYLTNNHSLQVPFVGTIVSAAIDVASLVRDYIAGNIKIDEFFNSGLAVCANSAISGLVKVAGQILIPIPILGEVISSFVGKIFAIGKGEEIAKRMRQDMKDFMSKIDTAYQEVIRRINAEFDRLGKLTEAAFDFERNINLVAASIDLARGYGVPEKDIIHNHDELDAFMMG